MLTRRSILLIAVLTAAVLMPTASAASSRFATTVVVSLRYPAFHGTLRSRTASCTKHRMVRLFRKRHGADRLLGTDKTNGKAEWAVPIGNKLPSGASYYAKAGAQGRCRAGKSKVLTIG